jgi:hypothetical protein
MRIFILIFLLAVSSNSIANEKLQNFDLLIFANKGEGCERYPYKFLKDLNGKEKIIQTDKNKPIHVGINSLISKTFDLTEKTFEKRVNRVQIFSDIFGRDVSKDFETIIQKSLEEFNFSKLKFGGYSYSAIMCDSNYQNYQLTTLLRLDLNLRKYKSYDGSSIIKNKLNNNQLSLLKVIPASDWIKNLKLKVENEFTDVRRSIKLLEENPESIAALVKYLPGEDYRQIKYKKNQSSRDNKFNGPCIVKAKSEIEFVLKNGYRISNEIINRFGLSKKNNFKFQTESLEALWQKIQTNECNVSFLTSDEFKKIKKVIEADTKYHYRVELGFDKQKTYLSSVQFMGYKDLSEFEFAQKFSPNLNPNQIKRLKMYNINNFEEVQKVIQKINSINYDKIESPNIKIIFQFLSDEEAGKKINLSATEYRKKRIEEAKILKEQQRIRQAQIYATRSKKSFVLRVVCMGNNSAGSYLRNIIQMYSSNTHVSAISSAIRSYPGCLLPLTPTPISGSRLTEYYRSGRFVGVRTNTNIDGQYIFGMLIASEWD